MTIPAAGIVTKISLDSIVDRITLITILGGPVFHALGASGVFGLDDKGDTAKNGYEGFGLSRLRKI